MPIDHLPQLFQIAGPASRAFLTGVRHRGQLVRLETGEARSHFVITLAAGVLVLVLALGALFTVTLAVAAHVWDLPNRAAILAGLAAGYLVVTALIGWWIRHRLRHWQPLGESRRQLGADCDWLEGLLPTGSGNDSPNAP